MTDIEKRVLQSSLGKLLSFDDGAEDVLEHLLTIDSKDDLSEYLVQLMGGGGQCLDDFVENVGRFQKGEPLILAEGCGGDVVTTKGGAENPPAQNDHTKPQAQSRNGALQGRRNQQHEGKKAKANSKSANRKSPPPPPSARTTNNAPKQQQQQQSGALSTTNMPQQQSASKAPLPAAKASPPERVVPKSHPKKGKATKVCGCFGTRHKPLTNCLYCGRISCVVEGYDFCPFCGLMVEEIKGTNANDKAWIQKERLLRFDRDFARRTEVFDDQADYKRHSAWMTEDEMADAQDKEEERQQGLRRPKQTINLAM